MLILSPAIAEIFFSQRIAGGANARKQLLESCVSSYESCSHLYWWWMDGFQKILCLLGLVEANGGWRIKKMCDCVDSGTYVDPFSFQSFCSGAQWLRQWPRTEPPNSIKPMSLTFAAVTSELIEHYFRGTKSERTRSPSSTWASCATFSWPFSGCRR